ncbi:hypothetical protein B4087_1133 [Bacillus cereus]|uniref:hypothetical protein n=1 Tax=Bacillus cereus TaxID=1396 RepID=UPI00062DC4AF|nr:hypothetical protein [Bacillus cereus]KLA16183.1 hypothetical protein B4087_1133 [Bacillus cereus]KMP68388.1 hypothetical protein TU57_08645 [Bacillus cereus]
MSEKVKVKREVADALRDLFSRKSEDYSRDEILKLHYRALMEGRVWRGEIWEHLNKLSMSEMAQAMFIGYEIEQTPEETFNYFHDKYSKSNIQFERDFLNGMIAVAEWFNLDVKRKN